MTRAAEAVQRAQDLLVFADGIEEAGLANYAHRARLVAQDALRLAEQLDMERRSRLEQKQRDEARELWMQRAQEIADGTVRVPYRLRDGRLWGWRVFDENGRAWWASEDGTAGLHGARCPLVVEAT